MRLSQYLIFTTKLSWPVKCLANNNVDLSLENLKKIMMILVKFIFNFVYCAFSVFFFFFEEIFYTYIYTGTSYSRWKESGTMSHTDSQKEHLHLLNL